MAQVICSVADCERPVLIRSRGWCSLHYQRWQRHGDPNIARRERPPQPTCSVPGCERDSRSGVGYCGPHYKRWRRAGEPGSAAIRDVALSTEARFWSKVEKRVGGCWIWRAHLFPTGYGHFGLNGVTLYAHRFAYELLVGPIPEGLELDHLCRVRACCNPAHLEPVTHAENVRRGMGGQHHARKTHCPQGHAFTAENTYIYPNGRRGCQICKKEQSHRSYLKMKRSS